MNSQLNAAMNSRGRKPGDYPSAGPLAHLIDFWNAGAPSIDFLAPDIYDTGFRMWAGRYAIPARPQDGGASLLYSALGPACHRRNAMARGWRHADKSGSI